MYWNVLIVAGSSGLSVPEGVIDVVTFVDEIEVVEDRTLELLVNLMEEELETVDEILVDEVVGIIVVVVVLLNLAEDEVDEDDEDVADP